MPISACVKLEESGGYCQMTILHRYNYHRPHTALKGLPVYRTLTVMNLHGCNT